MKSKFDIARISIKTMSKNIYEQTINDNIFETEVI